MRGSNIIKDKASDLMENIEEVKCVDGVGGVEEMGGRVLHRGC